MKIAITGASGFLGSHLRSQLSAAGHDVFTLVRRASLSNREIYWNPVSGEMDAARIEESDAVVHLAGANIAQGRWTKARKAEIFESRVTGTRLLAEQVARLNNPPAVLISSSATGYYGTSPDREFTEDSPASPDFLGSLCRSWEEACDPARDAGIRVVHLRTGMVISGKGGALTRMLPVFRLGLGGVIGSGSQYISWISLIDWLRIVEWMLANPSAAGPLNLTTPTPVTNREFTRTLGRILHRPTLFPLPSPLVRLLFGEMGESLLLGGARILPQQLVKVGFEYHFPDIELLLRHELSLP